MLCVKYVSFWNLINSEIKRRKMHNILLPLPQCLGSISLYCDTRKMAA
jgi:hypothetical protein